MTDHLTPVFETQPTSPVLNHVPQDQSFDVARTVADPLTEPLVGAAQAARLTIIDKLRGLVIILMVLDHVRDFFQPAHQISPTNVAKTTVALFVTRWVTHLCAPTFVLLAGVAVRLQWEKGKRGWPLTRFLLLRGLWLIVLEVTLVSAAFTFGWQFTLLQVIWAIGASMILMGLLAWLPAEVLLVIGLAIVIGHNLLDTVAAKTFGIAAPVWTLLWAPGSVHLPIPGFENAYVSYPVLPWFGIMAVGFGLGGLFRLPPARCRWLLVAGGLTCLCTFALLRGFNLYGNPTLWTPQVEPTRTFLSFLNVAKYPPSLDYVLVTLGIVVSLAPAVERIGGRAGQVLLVFGRTPLFTYLLHLYIARGLAILLAAAQGLSPAIFIDAFGSDRLAASGWGLHLVGIYATWLIVLLILWPLSTWYAGFKSRHRYWWLSFI